MRARSATTSRSLAAVSMLGLLWVGCADPPVPPPPEAIWLSTLERQSGGAIIDGAAVAVTWAAIPIADIDRAQLAPLLGRPPLAIDEVLLSYPLWADAFDRKPEVVGLEIELDGRTVRIVGVAPDYLREDLGGDLEEDIVGLWLVTE